MGLKPFEIYELCLWEFNMYLTGAEDKQKQDISNCILTGYYCAYYMNSGKKAKKPNELIQQLYMKKQSLTEGFKDIERFKALEEKMKKGG